MTNPIAHQLRAEASPQLVRLAAEQMRSGNRDAARELFLGALSADFGNVSAWQGLASVALGPDRHAGAIAIARRALAMDPDNPGLMSNLGNILCRAQRFEEAEVLLTRACELSPGALHPHYNIGLVYYATGRADLAVAAWERALAIGPDSPGLRGDYAHGVLKSGDLTHGLELLEARWEGLLIKNPCWECGLPKWAGEDLGGGTLLLHHEQGFGDTLQFVRFVPGIKARAGAGRVIFAAPKPLQRLLKDQCGIDEVIDDCAPGGIVRAAREALYHCPLMSAVAMLRPEYGPEYSVMVWDCDRKWGLVISEPYLTVPPDAAEPRALFRAGGAALSVGLCSGAAPTPERGSQKSVPLAEMLELASIPDVRFWSLQFGPHEQQIVQNGAEGLIGLVPNGIGDFADTAAIMNKLDLIVSIDTSAAHLAGALGRPVFMLNPINPCWRWAKGPTPWYLSMSIFDQTDATNWRHPIACIKARIAEMAAERRATMAEAA